MDYVTTTETLIPLAQAISKRCYNNRPIPIGRIKIIEVLACPKTTEFLCSVGTANMVVTQHHGITTRWDVDRIMTEDEYTNTRIRFLGKGAHEES